MSIQGNTATIRKPHVARRSPPKALAVVRDDPEWMRFLLIVFMITLFIPKSIALNLGTVALTPTLAISIILFPVLLSGRRIQFTWPDFVVVAFFLSVFYSSVRSTDLSVSIESIGRMVLVSGVPYLMGRYIGTRPGTFNPFMRRLMTAMAVLAVFLLLESLFRFNIHSALWSEPYSPHPEQRLGLTRAYGWTSHSIMLGVSYAVFVPVMAIAAIERMKSLGKYRWLKLGLLLIGVFCSLSTGAWLPAVIAICLVAWDYLKLFKPGTRWLLLSGGSLFLYFVLEILSGRPLLRILMMDLHLSSSEAWHYRWQLYQRVYSVMPGYEWFGHGLVTPENLAEFGWQWSIDNNYLIVLMQNGRVGLTLWLAIGVSVLFYGWKAVWNAPDTPYHRVARAVMFAVATIGLTQLSVAMFSTGAMLNWMFMGLGVGMAQGLALTSRGNKRGTRKRSGTSAKRPDRHAAVSHEQESDLKRTGHR